MSLEIGKSAPAFSGPIHNGSTIALKDFKGKTVVLYFYPKDDTPGCTKEACHFRDQHSALLKKGAVVIGVSPDSVKSHDKFVKKFDLPFPLIADEDKSIAQAYEVWVEKSMYGKKYMGVERSTFVIDAKGKLSHIFRKVKPETHVDEVIEHL